MTIIIKSIGDTLAMSKNAFIFGAAAAAVVLVMLFSFLTSEEGYSVREDVVVGDYIEYEFYAEQHIAYDMEMNVNEFYDRFLHYDVSQMTQGEDALYPYKGSDLECRTFHSDDTLVYLAKGSDVPVYEEEDYYSLHYVRSLVSTTVDLTKPVSPSDITEGTELKRVDVQTGGDANTTERLMTVGKIDEQGNTAVALKMLVLMEETVDLTVASVDGDMLTMENGDEYDRDSFLSYVSYAYKLQDLKEQYETIIEESDSRERFDLPMGNGYYDVHTLVTEGLNKEERTFTIAHLGDAVALHEMQFKTRLVQSSYSSWKLIGSSLLEK